MPRECGAPDELSRDEQLAVHLAHGVRETGDVAGLVTALHHGPPGRRQVRDALDCLGELDRALLVDLALDALLAAHVAVR